MPQVASSRIEETRERLRGNFPLWAAHCAKIISKEKRQIPFVLNEAQLAFHAALEEQRLAGKPRRGISLKARQVGISTYIQAKMIHHATLNQYVNCVTVAHDGDTGAKLYRIGERVYNNLPSEGDDAPLNLKPPKKSHRRGKYLHFLGDDGFPDSDYYVDTAGEFQAGRGGTYLDAHLSEFAFWPQPETKFTGLAQTIPDIPDSLIVIESTAQGSNMFKDLWDDAVEGRSDYTPHFWAWWQQPEYTLPFSNEAERERFMREVGTGPYGDEEPEFLNPGPLNVLTGERQPLTMEQLHWRRRTIANKTGGKLLKFHEEYPSTPQQAFVSTGRQVFDQFAVSQISIDVELNWDPRIPSPDKPPQGGQLRSGKTIPTKTMGGDVIQKPASPLWVPESKLTLGDSPDWKLWTPPAPDAQYIIGVDVSGAQSGGEQDETDEPAWDAIQVINHKTLEQAAEFHGRVPPEKLAEQAYLAALYFNEAWLAIEITGSWGEAPNRKVALEYKYPFVYRRRKQTGGKVGWEKTLGWDTTAATKPLLIARGDEMLRLAQKEYEETGTQTLIKSRALLLEFGSYIKKPTGKTTPEQGKFSDLLMAWLIAQKVAEETVVKKPKGSGRSRHTAHDNVTGY